jgi:transposase InsO family protein
MSSEKSETALPAYARKSRLYVAAVVDLFSRRVVGLSMYAAMTPQLVTDALVVGQSLRASTLRDKTRPSRIPRFGPEVGSRWRIRRPRQPTGRPT